MSGRVVEPRLFVWVAVGSPNEPPARIEVAICDRCDCLVPAGGAEARHAAYHARTDGDAS